MLNVQTEVQTEHIPNTSCLNQVAVPVFYPIISLDRPYGSRRLRLPDFKTIGI
jgi:hypothetical protein